LTLNPLIPIALSWILFCSLHSLLIAFPLADWLRRLRPGCERYTRLVYNSIALITLIPPVYFSLSANGTVLFSWDGRLRWIRAALALWALLLFWGGSRQYDIARFLGLTQLQETSQVHQTDENVPLIVDGVLNIVRHPWYSGGIALIWARDVTPAALVTNLILTLYFVVGALLEERRLVRQYGAVYQRYQRNVDMFFPLRRFLQRSNESE